VGKLAPVSFGAKLTGGHLHFEVCIMRFPLPRKPSAYGTVAEIEFGHHLNGETFVTIG